MNKRNFKPYLNPTYCSIHIDNWEVLIKIFLQEDKDGLRFILDFNHNIKVVKKEFELIKSKEINYSSEDVSFKDIQLNQIDKNKIADCLNKILDNRFG